MLGDTDTHDRLVRELLVGFCAAAVFPVYDLAPETKSPTQVEQNYAVAQWITARAHGTRWMPSGWRCAGTHPAAACPWCSP